ncbi:hypothetical protein [Crateriforma spongiae]|uniref:hypothetical protein n=1 Tax=Crateriforma spongiae TaxID=2724528 RepID=UPI001444AA26|nr:hypothetical protein [Crateriforma spongiae]
MSFVQTVAWELIDGGPGRYEIRKEICKPTHSIAVVTWTSENRRAVRTGDWLQFRHRFDDRFSTHADLMSPN